MNTPSSADVQPARAGVRATARRLRLGLAGAMLTAVIAGLLPAGAALAATTPPHADRAPAPAAHPATAPPAASPPASRPAGRPAVAPVPGQQPIPGTRAACATAKPGHAQCLALVRTNIKAQASSIAAGAAPAGYGPADLQSAYNLPSSTAGAGQTVAIVNAYDDPNAAADLATYRAQYGLPACTQTSGCFRKVSQDGTSNYPLPDDSWAVAASLGTDMVSAICPNCRILLVEANSASLDDLGAAVNEAVALGAKYVSTSYLAPEGLAGTFPAQLARDDALYYNHPGVAITATGYNPNGGVGYPASSPDVTAVGGTTLTRDTSAARGWTETAWSSGWPGSGCSAGEPKPAWQKDTGCAQRTVADVSAVNDPLTGVAVYDTYTAGFHPGWNVAGGAAPPIIASVYALAGTPSTAASPASYPYADPSALNDVTTGGAPIGTCTPAYLCKAGPGYDGPTGLGTPNGAAAFSYGVHGTHGDLTGTVTDAATGKPVAGAQVTAGGYTAVTGSDGRYDLAAVPGTADVTASGFGYAAKTLTGVTVIAGQAQTENFTLAAVPMQTVTGTVTDGSGPHWPLYAQVSVPGTPVRTYTDPATGHYTLHLPAGTYTIHAYPVSPGYQQAAQQTTIGTAAVTQDLTVPVDEMAGCTAPGYHTAPVLTEDFSQYTLPAGWNVVTKSVDNAHHPYPANTWYFAQNKPGSWQNYTGTSGNFAMAWEGDGAWTIDTALITPVMNMSGDPYPQLNFNQANAFTHSVVFTVDASTDGGQTWSTVWKVPGNHGLQVAPVTVALPQAAGKPSVQLRFHTVGPLFSGPGVWEISNIDVSDCAPASGGLLVGHVRDANTRGGVAGATITGAGQAGVSTTSIQVPGDPVNGDGFYALFSGTTGTPQVTATANGYAAASAAPRVTPGQVTSADFALKAGRLAVSTRPVTATETLGGKATATVAVRNTGTAPVTLHTDALPGVFAGPAAAGPRKAAAGVPVQRIRGHFSPRPGPQPAAAGRAGPQVTASAPSWSDATGWSPIAGLPAAVGGNAGAVDPVTGRIYSVGGAADSSGLRDTAAVTMYDPATRQWSALPPMRHVRWGPQAVVLGGKLYVTGGFNYGQYVAALEIYDPASGTWSAGSPIPHAYADAATVALNGKMYVIGGCGTITCGQTDVQVYDPRTDQWSAAADYPLPTAWTGCGAIAGKIYCAGGVGGLYTSATRSGYVYDPRANTWTPIADMPSGLWGGSHGAADGKLLISGGISADNTVLTNQGYAYDPATNTWSPLPNAPMAAYEDGSACGFYQFGGWVYPAAGGATSVAAQLPGYGGCGGQNWLSATPATLTLAPGQTATVKVTLAATTPSVDQPGTYTAALRIGSDDPYTAPAVPVTLTVTPPKTWGQLTGTITGHTCAGGTRPLPGATVQVGGGRSTSTVITDAQGKYSLWVDTTHNPFTVIASQPGWQTNGAQVQVKAQAATTQDFTLNQTCG